MYTPSQEERTMALLTHLSGLAGFVVPFGNIIAPLIIWQIKKDQSAFVNDQGKEAVNFQISFTLYAIAAGLLILLAVGVLLLPLVGLAGLILMIIAALKANQGVAYRYPFTLRLIK
jgi:hypothetical protein